ncbi:MAG: hypothetical protein JJU06_15835 [Ectothiorhodospiraceae bacterium]|nr:hypothetical protein [Ectothiorhodospiraceae bacterium]MCH8506319.1 hypothetical protein [Ectothiorhodospiraceae bacterium]
MKGIAQFVMQYRLSAILLIGVTGLLPILVWFGNAILSLVTLRRGPAEGALILGAAALVYGLAELVMGRQMVAAVGLLLLVWLPMYGVALLLRVTISLSLALLGATAFAALMLLFWHLMVPDAHAFWQGFLAPLLEDMSQQQREETLDFVVNNLMAYVALGLWANLVMGLLLGRYWQALLFNPGGFRQEFHALRFDRRLAVVSMVMLLAASVVGQGAVFQFGVILSTPFVLQGVAMVHGLATARNWSRLWLVLLYVSMPFIYVPVALIGILDSFMDFRQRFGKRSADTG